MQQRLTLRVALLLGAFAVLSLSPVSSIAQSNGDKGFGLVASDKVSFSEIGLPAYPGARPYKETSNDSSQANLGFWSAATGFKLVVMKFESDDAPEKIADFYRKGLAKYGKVLDCTKAPGGDKPPQESSSKELTCGDDHPEPGNLVLKAGSKPSQHLVGIKRVGNRTQFQLLYLESKQEHHYD